MGLFVFAQSASAYEKSSWYRYQPLRMSETFAPCQSWRMARDGMGYVCAWPGMTVQIPSQSDYQMLEQRVRELERKLSGQ